MSQICLRSALELHYLLFILQTKGSDMRLTQGFHCGAEKLPKQVKKVIYLQYSCNLNDKTAIDGALSNSQALAL